MFRSVAGAIERVLDVVLLVMIAVMAVSICWQVFGRYVLNDAPGWTEETARFLMAWITMLGSALVMRRNGHVAVTFVADLLPPGPRAVIAWIRDTLILVMAGSLVFYGYKFAVIGGRRDSAALEIPMFWPYLAIPVGGALIAILLALHRADGLRTGTPS
ncbi:TRAP transporter small permease [Microbaculum marinum]|uniref:TRAP transporter small permease protein n=1 Tax=Microbaculum marinum TaxID=1764581 RepID=A0AAW9RQS6_9HYPH